MLTDTPALRRRGSFQVSPGAGRLRADLYPCDALDEHGSCPRLAEHVDPHRIVGCSTLLAGRAPTPSGRHSSGPTWRWSSSRDFVCSLAEELIVQCGPRTECGRRPGTWRIRSLPADLHFYSQIYHDWPPERCRFPPAQELRQPGAGRPADHPRDALQRPARPPSPPRR